MVNGAGTVILTRKAQTRMVDWGLDPRKSSNSEFQGFSRLKVRSFKFFKVNSRLGASKEFKDYKGP